MGSDSAFLNGNAVPLGNCIVFIIVIKALKEK